MCKPINLLKMVKHCEQLLKPGDLDTKLSMIQQNFYFLWLIIQFKMWIHLQ